LAALVATTAFAQVTRYIRYESAGRTAYGILDGETVRELSAAPWNAGKPTGRTVAFKSVKLLPPAEPSKVIAAGLNYNVHFEGELVIVIGKTASKVPKAQALDHVFGATIGNDVSERAWQKQDLQWFRAKAADTFGPLGPWIVTGVNYQDALLETRVNGKTLQSQRTKDLIFDIPTIVSYVSQYVTLLPGDVIYTGTPGTTSAMKPGDVVEVEIEGIGVLRNRVVKAAAQ
jgi:2-keto-4-pentenoate hydratase/2-oxohepta-3-ene-1,7-dioic acid hydratase in catechol pathway